MKKILIISGDMCDDSELQYPFYRLLEEDFIVDIASKDKKSIVAKSGHSTLDIKYILDIRDFSNHELGKHFTTDFNDILNDASVDLTVL